MFGRVVCKGGAVIGIEVGTGQVAVCQFGESSDEVVDGGQPRFHVLRTAYEVEGDRRLFWVGGPAFGDTDVAVDRAQIVGRTDGKAVGVGSREPVAHVFISAGIGLHQREDFPFGRQERGVQRLLVERDGGLVVFVGTFQVAHLREVTRKEIGFFPGGKRK